MLVLTRKANEQVLIGNNIILSIVEVRGNRVKLGIDAPPGVDIMRAELLNRPVPLVVKPGARRILIVDDCPEDRQLVRRCLAPARPQFEFAETDLGAQGLQLCREQPPDCVLLDYQLPDLDGLEFLHALRCNHAGRAIPVILVTGQGSEAVAVEAMKHGARDYVVKQTISPELLQRAVYDALHQPFAN
jgi:carbon storage regulator CsrA